MTGTGHIPRSRDPWPEPEHPVMQYPSAARSDFVRISCPQCGKPEHGSVACGLAPDWPEPQYVTFLTATASPLPLRVRLAARFWDALAAFDRWLYWTWGRGSEGWRRK